MKVLNVTIDGLKIKIIDTIGIGDTNLTKEEVLVKLARAMHHIRNGVHQVLFCTGGRFTHEEVDAFKVMVSVLLSPEVRYPKFRLFAAFYCVKGAEIHHDCAHEFRQISRYGENLGRPETCL